MDALLGSDHELDSGSFRQQERLPAPEPLVVRLARLEQSLGALCGSSPALAGATSAGEQRQGSTLIERVEVLERAMGVLLAS